MGEEREEFVRVSEEDIQASTWLKFEETIYVVGFGAMKMTRPITKNAVAIAREQRRPGSPPSDGGGSSVPGSDRGPGSPLSDGGGSSVAGAQVLPKRFAYARDVAQNINNLIRSIQNNRRSLNLLSTDEALHVAQL